MSIQQMTVIEDAEEPDAPEDEVFINVESNVVCDRRQTWLREARSLCGDDLESLASEAAEEFQSLQDQPAFLMKKVFCLVNH